MLGYNLCVRRTSARPLVLATLAIATGVAALAPKQAAAQVYLVGAGLYSATSTGATATTGYLYDTNTANSTFTLQLVLNGVTYNKGIAIPLSGGANNFTINPSPNGAVDPGTYAGVELFFSSSATSYNPSTTARTPDLVLGVNVDTGVTSDFTPAAGVPVESYNFSASVAANGLTSYSVGSTPVRVSNYTETHSATGAFTVTVAPEPDAVNLALLGGLPIVGAMGYRFARRRSALAG